MKIVAGDANVSTRYAPFGQCIKEAIQSNSQTSYIAHIDIPSRVEHTMTEHHDLHEYDQPPDGLVPHVSRDRVTFISVLTLVVLVSIGLVLAAPVVGAQDDLDNGGERALSNDVVAPGGSVTVETTIQFDEPTSGTLTESIDPAVDTIEIIDDDGADSSSVSGDASSVSFSFSDRSSVTVSYELTFDEGVNDGDEFDISGSWENDESVDIPSDTITVVEGPIFEITDIDAPERIPPGQAFDVTVTVDNTGTSSDTQTVDLLLDGTTVQSSDAISLGPGEQAVVSFEELTIEDDGWYILTAETAQHERSVGLSVESFAHFEVEMVQVPDTVTDVDEFIVTTIVTNSGDLPDTQDIVLQIDDETVTTIDDVTLEPDETQLLNFDPVRIPDLGEHEIRVASEDTSLMRSISVVEANVSISLDDQLIGADTRGSTAIFVERLTGDEGWSILATYEDNTGTTVVAGIITLDASVEQALRSVPIDDDAAYPGDIEVLVAINTDDVTVGEPLPDEVEILQSDTASIYESSVEVYAQTYDDATDRVVVSAAALFDEPGFGSTPYIIGLYREVDGDLEIIGQSNPIWGAENDIEIALDRPIEDEGVYDLVVRLHWSTIGQRGDPIQRLEGSSPGPKEMPVTVRIVDTPSFVIQGINRDTNIDAGEQIEIEITVTNVGEARGTQTLWVSAGEWVQLVDLSLDPGETTTVTVTRGTSIDDIGEMSLFVDTVDDQELATLQIDEPGDTDTPNGDPIPGFGVLFGLLAFGLMAHLLIRYRR